MKVTVVGAGFSGLTLAYYLVKRGVAVEIVEKADRVGGMISTRKETFGLVETAASGIWNSLLVEELFADLSLPAAFRQDTRKKRYIYRGRPRRWPLSFWESLRAVKRFFVAWTSKKLSPTETETVFEWGSRVGGEAFAKYLLAPALQGVYAGDATRMSAKLILKRHKSESVKLRGTIAPAAGMGELMTSLSKWLRDHGVTFRMGDLQDHQSRPLVLATSAWDAAEILKELSPENALILNRVEALPLVSVTLFFSETPKDYRGFGCLFPATENFQALGVLFNTDIFAGRVATLGRSETWILGGALKPALINESDDILTQTVLKDRAKLFGKGDEPEQVYIQRWPKALPHYTVEWKKRLEELSLPEGVYLTGNYLGQIGLAKILARNKSLAETIHG